MENLQQLKNILCVFHPKMNENSPLRNLNKMRWSIYNITNSYNLCKGFLLCPLDEKQLKIKLCLI